MRNWVLALASLVCDINDCKASWGNFLHLESLIIGISWDWLVSFVDHARGSHSLSKECMFVYNELGRQYIIYIVPTDLPQSEILNRLISCHVSERGAVMLCWVTWSAIFRSLVWSGQQGFLYFIYRCSQLQLIYPQKQTILPCSRDYHHLALNARVHAVALAEYRCLWMWPLTLSFHSDYLT